MSVETAEVIRPGMILTQLPILKGVVPLLADGESWFVGQYSEEHQGYETRVGRELFDQTAIRQTLGIMACRIAQECPDSNLVIVGLEKGASVIQQDLATALLSRESGYVEERLRRSIKASSYHNGTESSGVVEISGDPGNLKDAIVVVLDDILETGYTLEEVKKYMKTLGVKDVRVAVLFRKLGKQQVAEEKLGSSVIVGHDIEDLFLVGYGIDWANLFRNLRRVVGLDKRKILYIPRGLLVPEGFEYEHAEMKAA